MRYSLVLCLFSCLTLQSIHAQDWTGGYLSVGIPNTWDQHIKLSNDSTFVVTVLKHSRQSYEYPTPGELPHKMTFNGDNIFLNYQSDEVNIWRLHFEEDSLVAYDESDNVIRKFIKTQEYDFNTGKIIKQLNMGLELKGEVLETMHLQYYENEVIEAFQLMNNQGELALECKCKKRKAGYGGQLILMEKHENEKHLPYTSDYDNQQLLINVAVFYGLLDKM